MPEMMSIKVEGLKELEKKMISLGPKISLKALRSSLAAGAKVIKQDAMARVPVKTGTLRKSLYIKRLTKPNPYAERYILGARHGKKMQKRNLDAYYWSWIEFGHKDRSGKAVDPRPFIRPAFESRKIQAMDTIKQVLKTKIEKLVRETP
jgi:HK97 gp10 family phage protein